MSKWNMSIPNIISFTRLFNPTNSHYLISIPMTMSPMPSWSPFSQNNSSVFTPSWAFPNFFLPFLVLISSFFYFILFYFSFTIFVFTSTSAVWAEEECWSLTSVTPYISHFPISNLFPLIIISYIPSSSYTCHHQCTPSILSKYKYTSSIVHDISVVLSLSTTEVYCSHSISL